MGSKFEVGDEVLHGPLLSVLQLELVKAMAGEGEFSRLWRIIRVRSSGKYYDIEPVAPIRGCASVQGVKEEELHYPSEFQGWDQEEV
jgi:hypothetical protein